MSRDYLNLRCPTQTQYSSAVTPRDLAQVLNFTYTMPLENIIWNDVYAAKKSQRTLGEYRVYVHYKMLGLEK